jgi:hypothetical protein
LGTQAAVGAALAAIFFMGLGKEKTIAAKAAPTKDAASIGVGIIGG